MKHIRNASPDKISKFSNMLVKRNHARKKEGPRKKRECKAIIEKQTEQDMLNNISLSLKNYELYKAPKMIM
jgi:hypothetical protein